MTTEEFGNIAVYLGLLWSIKYGYATDTVTDV